MSTTSPPETTFDQEPKKKRLKSDIAEFLEDVLVVPKRLTKTAHDLLSKYNACPRPYHLEGRFGSRTHRSDDESMCIPIISKNNYHEKAETHSELQELLSNGGVSIVRKPFVPSNRAHDNPEFDARMHPEREQKPITLQSDSPNTVDVAEGGARFTYAEVFAGIGGFGVALEALGGTCTFCSELEEHCRALYQNNFKTPASAIHGDIYKVKDSDFPKNLDLLVGGFPCQPFSSLGTQPGFECEKGRGHLFQEIVRVLNISRPKGFLLENVQGLLNMTDTYNTILSAFQKAGYIVTTEVCTSRGVTATTRKRLFFVGIRDDLPNAKEPFLFPFVPDLKLRASDVLDYDDLPEEELKILRLSDETFERLLNNGRNWRPKSMAWPNRVCETLISHYGNAVARGESQFVPCHAPHHPRRFSIRECARLMGFPNSFQMLPPREHQGDMAYRKEHYRMFGNAVCPPLIAVLAGAVLARILPSAEDPDKDWVKSGSTTSIALAKAATRAAPAPLPPGCFPVCKTKHGVNSTKETGKGRG